MNALLRAGALKRGKKEIEGECFKMATVENKGGRPLRCDIDYWQLNIIDSLEIQNFITWHGSLGEGVLVGLLKKMGGNKKTGFYLPCDDNFKVTFCKEKILTFKQFDELRDAMLNFGVFSKELFDKYQILTSHDIQLEYLQIKDRSPGVYEWFLKEKKDYILVTKKEVSDLIKVVNLRQNVAKSMVSANNNPSYCGNNPQKSGVSANKNTQTKGENTEPYHPIEDIKRVSAPARGIFQNVFMTDEEYEMLKKEIGQQNADEMIKEVSTALKRNNNLRLDSHCAAALSWFYRREKGHNGGATGKAAPAADKPPTAAQLKKKEEDEYFAQVLKFRDTNAEFRALDDELRKLHATGQTDAALAAKHKALFEKLKKGEQQ